MTAITVTVVPAATMSYPRSTIITIEDTGDKRTAVYDGRDLIAVSEGMINKSGGASVNTHLVDVTPPCRPTDLWNK